METNKAADIIVDALEGINNFKVEVNDSIGDTIYVTVNGEPFILTLKEA